MGLVRKMREPLLDAADKAERLRLAHLISRAHVLGVLHEANPLGHRGQIETFAFPLRRRIVTRSRRQPQAMSCSAHVVSRSLCRFGTEGPNALIFYRFF